MGDRNNPIKFGPEWLRNISRERNGRGSGASNRNVSSGPNSTSVSPGPGAGPMGGAVVGQSPGAMVGPNAGTPTGTAGPTQRCSRITSSNARGRGAVAGGQPIPGPSTGAIPRNTAQGQPSRVLLARLRYGREEMLALYDRSSESPGELKRLEIYQSRGKPPFALNNTFEEDVRDSVRGGPPVGNNPVLDRYIAGGGRGVRRGVNTSEAPGRSRMPFVRQTSLGRGHNSWHANNTRMPMYNTGPEEDATLRPWNNGNGGGNPTRTSNEQPEWNPNKMFRRRQNNNTNWRQSNARDESDEWRSQENQRNRPAVDKWDREWGERQNTERPWISNRRTWVGNESQNEDNLPEWAVDNTEAGAGTFDSSGAFHGYSNDDTNLPKSQETSFPLARSHTHGSFSRSKTAEEGSAEWWGAEQAKKMSLNNFETTEPKFSKDTPLAPSNLNTPLPSGADNDINKALPGEENLESPEIATDNISNGEDTQQNIFANQFQDSTTFEALMRSEIDLEDSSVIMPPQHQMHQNLNTCGIDPTGRQRRNSGLLQMFQVLPINQPPDNESGETPEDKLVEKILDMTLEDAKLPQMIGQMHPSCINPGMPNQMPNPNLQLQIGNPVMPNHGLGMKGVLAVPIPGLHGPMQPMQNVGMRNQINPIIQNVGVHNSALNSSLGLPIGPSTNSMHMGMQNPPPVMPSPGMQGRLGYQAGGGMPMMPGANVNNASLFMTPNNQPPMRPNEMPLPNHNTQSNLFSMHQMQQSGSQGSFGSMYNMQQGPPPINPDPNLADTWYYEDPEKVIQGPFSSREMYTWYRAGFFTRNLLVRRATETHLRPLGTYGNIVPFVQLDMHMSTYPMSAVYDTRQRRGMGIDDSLWSQPSPSDMIWMQQVTPRNESRINNLPMYFWEPQATSAISSNSLLPEEIAKEMKTEDQILAQLRASQNLPTPPTAPFTNDNSTAADVVANLTKAEENFPTNVSATPNLDELQKLIQPETLSAPSPAAQVEPEPEKKDETVEAAVKHVPLKVETAPPEPESVTLQTTAVPKQQQSQPKPSTDIKQSKTKNDTEKTAKKENSTKVKNKKAKEDKKDETPEPKKDEDALAKSEKRSVESSPTKTKKEEKQNKKEQDKEKKELVKDGFTIVKGVDKNINKENKKKLEEAKAAAAAVEEAERKKKEEVAKLALEEEKKRKIADAIKKAQEQQQLRQDAMPKKAPWSIVGGHAVATTRDGLTLAEIQRLEREKKVEQMKEQQQMMHLIAQQQAAVIAREQEMQAGLGWAKKKASNVNVSGQSLGDIQAETRKAAAAAAATAAAAAAQALDEPVPLATINNVPWAGAHNGGFWETSQANASAKTEKPAETVKPSDTGKGKKKVTINSTKKDATPTVEFEAWCTNILSPWSSKIDVATFIGFLKDIESPYEVKDYVKCYLGETKESGDFARQFLERRSKLLRVGMVTPSDDLCSPAMAINPRNTNLGEYQEVKGKGKKAKKNKMLKVDARILGFSVTASEDRINVGDIDTV